MTTSYNRSEIISFYELSEVQKSEVLNCYFNSEEDAEQDSFVMFDSKNGESALPLGMFMRTSNNKFTHGIYSTSAFDGYFLTLSKSGDACVIAHKYF